MSRYREPQLQVGENYSYLFNLRLAFENHFFPSNRDFEQLTKRIKTTVIVISELRVNLNIK